jgi:hypothetical protein
MSQTNGEPVTASSTLQQQQNGSGSNGIVRRLSVTARPGDIFYKVKDVTESSSTTDHQTTDDTNTNLMELGSGHHIEQEIIIQANHNNNNEDQSAGSSATAPVMSSGRKITTWNVKRNQTTSLGIKTNQNSNGGEFLSKDDSSIDTLIDHPAAAAVDPSKPVLSRDMMSIR